MKISEHWMIERDDENPDHWSGCRVTKVIPDAWGDTSWNMWIDDKTIVRVHLLCEHYKSYREQIREIIAQMKLDNRMNYWVTYSWVTVDFRE